ncbi:MAG: hypothetical protein ABL921_31445 [Pirellula sp.]
MNLRYVTAASFAFAFIDFLAFGVGDASQVLSQTSESTPISKQLQIAIGRLDNSLAEDWDKAEAELKLAMHDPALRELAICSMALVHVKQGNLEALANFNGKSQVLFPMPSLDRKSFLLRMQLSCDIALESKTASERFSNLVQSTLNDKLSKDSRLAGASMLGTITGMLELDVSQSPIDREQLSTAKDSLLKSPDTALAITFDSSYRKASTHADALADWLMAHNEQSLDEATNAAKDYSERLRDATHDRSQSVAMIRRDTKEHRKAIYDLSRKKVAIQQEINAVLFQWNCHPEVHNPTMPDRQSIRVKTTERVKIGTRTERVKKTRYRNGEKETYYENEKVDDYETRPRKQSAIDRDIDAIYLPRFNQYLALKTAGQSLMDRKANWEGQLQSTVAEIAVSNQSIKELEKRGKTEQADLEQLREEAGIAVEAINALKSGRTELAFRSPNFELFDFMLETKVLQNGLADIEK